MSWTYFRKRRPPLISPPRANALLLPEITRWSLPGAMSRYAQVARWVGIDRVGIERVGIDRVVIDRAGSTG